jgi:hypothetical protein
MVKMLSFVQIFVFRLRDALAELVPFDEVALQLLLALERHLCKIFLSEPLHLVVAEVFVLHEEELNIAFLVLLFL